MKETEPTDLPMARADSLTRMGTSTKGCGKAGRQKVSELIAEETAHSILGTGRMT